MMNKKERMEKLNNAGVNTQKYFNIDLPQGLKPGSTISVVINENGQPVLVNNNDVVANQIIESGYVRNTKLHRRFVMAQMFHMLNWKSHSGMFEGYTDCLNMTYGYDYTFKMMLEEIKVLSKLEVRDRESFIERSHFFTKEVVVEVLYDYVEKLKSYVDGLPVKKCKKVPYKKIKGENIFVEDLNKKLYHPMENEIRHMKFASNYTELYKLLRDFMRGMVKLPYNTVKSKAWVDAYKGEGAYYTLKNLVMFHDCAIYVDRPTTYGHHTEAVYDGPDAVKFIKNKLDEYHGEGWRMFALMKKVIKDNGIDTKTHIAEVSNK